MGLIAILVFVTVFAVAAPLLVMAGGVQKSAQKKKVAAALDTALGGATGIVKADTVSFRKSDMVSAIPLFNRALVNMDVVPRISRLLKQAEVKWSPATLIMLSLVAFGLPAYLVNLRTGSFWVGAGIGAVTSMFPTFYVMFKRHQRFSKFEQGLPEAIDLIVSALRAGHSLGAAMGLVSRECPNPIGGEFRVMFDEQNFGLEMRETLKNLVTRVPLQDLKMMVTAIIIQRESGGNLAEVLDKTAYMVRQRFRLRKQIMVHTAQGRLTGLVLTILPIGVGIAMYIINPKNMSLLWTREIGIKLLIAAGVSLVIGSLLIQKIVHIKI
ncbi:MAG TPA: type II secretion system F family protein [Terracidiphilus sp.]|jgi:tight adherence protein B|nr:type II secretion system F family protein [Terracidiphilus sp.]